MKITIETDSLVKLLAPYLSWTEASIIAEVIDDKFECAGEPHIEDISEFFDSITLVKKRDNAEEYNTIKALYDNGLTENLRSIRFDCIYYIDEEAEVAVCGVYY